MNPPHPLDPGVGTLVPSSLRSKSPSPQPPLSSNEGERVHASALRTPTLTTVAMMLANSQYPNGNGNALGTRRSGPSRLPGPPTISVVPHKYANSPCWGQTSLYRRKLLGQFPMSLGSSSVYPSLLAEADCKILNSSLSKNTSPTLSFLLIPPTSLPPQLWDLKLRIDRAEGQSASAATAKPVAGQSEPYAIRQ